MCLETRHLEQLEDLFSEFSRKPAEERALIIIRNYFDMAERMPMEGGEMTGGLRDIFLDWFHDPHNDAAIETALERLTGVHCADVQFPTAPPTGEDLVE